MRVGQYKILNYILNQIEVPGYIHAFEKNKSIPAMAALHVNKEVVVSIDIKDFFHSIKQELVYNTFTSLGIEDKPARTLSEICTYKAFVPQGALTSPKLANIITACTFGPQVKELCDRHPELTLSIYADDITISSTDPATDVSSLLSSIMSIVRSEGFRVNREKTKVMWKNSRQYVCGVVVNKKTNMLKKERYRLRAIVHNITMNGLEAEALKNDTTPGYFASHIKGKLNWYKQLNSVLGTKQNDKLNQYLSQLPPTFETTTSSPAAAVGAVAAEETAVPW